MNEWIKQSDDDDDDDDDEGGGGGGSKYNETNTHTSWRKENFLLSICYKNKRTNFLWQTWFQKYEVKKPENPNPKTKKNPNQYTDMRVLEIGYFRSNEECAIEWKSEWRFYLSGAIKAMVLPARDSVSLCSQQLILSFNSLFRHLTLDWLKWLIRFCSRIHIQSRNVWLIGRSVSQSVFICCIFRLIF